MRDDPFPRVMVHIPLVSSHRVFIIVIVVFIVTGFDCGSVVLLAEMIKAHRFLCVDRTDGAVFVSERHRDDIPLRFHHVDKAVMIPAHRQRLVYRLPHQIVFRRLAVFLRDIDRARRSLPGVPDNRQALPFAHLVGQISHPVIRPLAAVVFLSVPHPDGVENEMIVVPLLSRIKNYF